MSGWVTDHAAALWNGLKSIFSGAVTEAETELEQVEADFLPKFHALIQTSIATIKGQAYTVLQEELVVISEAFLSGGDVAGAIAASVPKVLAEVATDAAADLVAVKNAVYTLIGLELATLTPKPVTAA